MQKWIYLNVCFTVDIIVSVTTFLLHFHSLKYASHHDHQQASFTVVLFADISGMFCPDNTFIRTADSHTQMVSFPCPYIGL